MFDHLNALALSLIGLATLITAGLALRLQLRHDRERRLSDQINSAIEMAELKRENERLRGETPSERRGSHERDDDADD